MKSTLQILIEARSRIEWRWTQGSYAVGGGAVCAVGALNKVERMKLDAEGNRSRASCAALLDVLPFPFGSIESFNDNENTKKQDILALYDRAIAAEEAKLKPRLPPIPEQKPQEWNKASSAPVKARAKVPA